jgi:glycosyltransferase involved in cell wall biosynthesis
VLQPFPPLARRVYRPIVKHLMSTASATVAAHDVFAAGDRALFGLPARAIPNGFDPDEFRSIEKLPSNDSTEQLPERPRVVAFAGSVREEGALNVFLDGLALAQSRAPGRWRFRYQGLAADRVAALAAARGVATITDVHGFVERAESLRNLAAADLLLALAVVIPHGELSGGLQPAKAFEYLGLKRPILGVPGDNGLLDALLTQTRAGTVARSAEEVARVLLDGPPPYAPNEAVVASHERSVLTGRLAALLDEVCDGPTA